jgi:sulfur carrier protein
LIKIKLNGVLTQVEKNCLVDFLALENKQGANFAIAVNEMFVPKSQYHLIELQDGDEIELVVPMQGG